MSPEDLLAFEEEIAQDNERADAAGLVFDSDPRKTAGTGAAQDAALAPAGPGAA